MKNQRGDMNQEYETIKQEINQYLVFGSEHTDKSIYLVVIIWGLALGWQGNSNLMELNVENIPKLFITSSIFFIANMVLYCIAKKRQGNSEAISKLAAYIMIFHEKPPRKPESDNSILSWSTVNFETTLIRSNNNPKERDRILVKTPEYSILMMISIAILLILSALLLFNSNFQQENTNTIIISCILILVTLGYIIYSVILLRSITKYTTIKSRSDTQIGYLSDFIQYTINKGYEKEDDIKERLGNDLYLYIIDKANENNKNIIKGVLHDTTN